MDIVRKSGGSSRKLRLKSGSGKGHGQFMSGIVLVTRIYVTNCSGMLLLVVSETIKNSVRSGMVRQMKGNPRVIYKICQKQAT